MVFDFERMEVYQQALVALDIAVEIANKIPRGHRNDADELKRSATGVVRNAAEGIGEFKPKEKARFYRMALRSASESCATIQIVHRLKFIDVETTDKAYRQFERVGKILTKLITL